MNIKNVDLNLLVYLDVLIKERNVTRAAEALGISQPAMSNGLRRLRYLFNDPLLVRTGEGMTPTERAESLQPVLRNIIENTEKAIQPQHVFEADTSDRVFRISMSDYTESTLLPLILNRLRREAPGITLDILNPSDVRFADVDQGKVDMVINRFDEMPQSFHQITVWYDTFSCMVCRDNPIRQHFDLKSYIEGNHVWVSKTGMGTGMGMNPNAVQRLGWVDEALAKIGQQRRITVFTRHYQAAMRLVEQQDLIVTLPTKAARLQIHNPKVVILAPPFDIPPMDLKMAWSLLVHHNPAHQWLRRLIVEVAARPSDYS